MYRTFITVLVAIFCVSACYASTDNLPDTISEVYYQFPAPDHPDTPYNEPDYTILANVITHPADGSTITAMFGTFGGPGYCGIGQIIYDPVTQTKEFLMRVAFGYGYGNMEKLAIDPSNPNRLLANYINITIPGDSKPSTGTLEVDLTTWQYRALIKDTLAYFLTGITFGDEGEIYRMEPVLGHLTRANNDGNNLTIWSDHEFLKPLVPGGQGANTPVWYNKAGGLLVSGFPTGDVYFVKKNPITHLAEDPIVIHSDPDFTGIDAINLSPDEKYLFSGAYNTQTGQGLVVRWNLSKNPVTAQVVSISEALTETSQAMPIVGSNDPSIEGGLFVTQVGLFTGTGALWTVKADDTERDLF